MKKYNVGVVIADDYEFEPFKKYAEKFIFEQSIENNNEIITFSFSDKIDVCAIKCGIGKVNATVATSFLVFAKNCNIILNIGLSGAIKKIHKGDIIVGSEHLECDFDMVAVGLKPGEKPGQNFIYKADEKLLSLAKNCSIDGVRRLGTGDIFLADKNLKERYDSLFDIYAFDMESAAIASVCRKTKTPFLSIRKISDDCDENACETYRELNNKKEIHLSCVLEEMICEIQEKY